MAANGKTVSQIAAHFTTTAAMIEKAANRRGTLELTLAQKTSRIDCISKWPQKLPTTY